MAASVHQYKYRKRRNSQQLAFSLGGRLGMLIVPFEIGLLSEGLEDLPE
jgi:hypothetical protein